LPYTIRFAPAAARELRKLAPAERQRLAPHIDGLADNPHPGGCKKLKGASAPCRGASSTLMLKLCSLQRTRNSLAHGSLRRFALILSSHIDVSYS
jgi:hypothetical protein